MTNCSECGKACNIGKCGNSISVYFPYGHRLDSMDFELKFCKVKEKKFFNTTDATHIVIKIIDKKRRQEYVIDPSFKVYALRQRLDNYSSFEDINLEAFFEYNKSRDKFFSVDLAAPIFIRKDYVINFSIESVDNKFDKSHYLLSLNATKTYGALSRGLFTLRFIDGHLQKSTDDQLSKELLSPNEIMLLTKKLLTWAVEIQAS